MQYTYLVRHGETDWNKKLLYQGQRDIPLNEAGRRQASRAAVYLKDKNIDLFYSSPLARASATAAMIAEQHGQQVYMEAGFMEIDFGKWEGRSYNEFDQDEQLIAQQWFSNPGAVNIPGGESYETFKTRVLQAFSKIRREYKNIAIVTHAGVIRAIMTELLEMPAAAATRLRIAPASLTIIMYDDWDNPYLQSFNESCYLG